MSNRHDKSDDRLIGSYYRTVSAISLQALEQAQEIRRFKRIAVFIYIGGVIAILTAALIFALFHL